MPPLSGRMSIATAGWPKACSSSVNTASPHQRSATAAPDSRLPRRTAADLATLEAALRLFGPRPGNDALTAARDAAQASQRALQHASRGPALLHEASQRRLEAGTSGLEHSVVASMASRDALDAAQHASLKALASVRLWCV